MLILSARLIASSALVCKNLRSFPQLSQEKPYMRYQMLQFNRPHACFRSINGMKSQRYPHNAARQSGTVSRKGVATRSGEHCGLVSYSTIWQAQLPPDRYTEWGEDGGVLSQNTARLLKNSKDLLERTGAQTTPQSTKMALPIPARRWSFKSLGMEP
jgi:hypothetical protein